MRAEQRAEQRSALNWIYTVLLASVAAGCGGAERPAHLPPPVYERPELPPWEPEAPPDDPLDVGNLEGEWVDEPPEEAAPGRDPRDPEARDPAVPGAPPSETSPAEANPSETSPAEANPADRREAPALPPEGESAPRAAPRGQPSP